MAPAASLSRVAPATWRCSKLAAEPSQSAWVMGYPKAPVSLRRSGGRSQTGEASKGPIKAGRAEPGRLPSVRSALEERETSDWARDEEGAWPKRQPVSALKDGNEPWNGWVLEKRSQSQCGALERLRGRARIDWAVGGARSLV